MANNGRPLLFQSDRPRRRRRMIPAVSGALAAVILSMAIVLVASGSEDRRDVPANASPQVEIAAPPVAKEPDAAEPEATEAPATPMPAQVIGTGALAAQRALTRPTPVAEGYSPVFLSANTEEKIIAITVDDCFQARNLEKIVNKTLEVGGKLTLFPIGKNALKTEQARILKYAWENGFELENHTFSHNGLYSCSDEEMAEEIYMQQMALSSILGVEYQPHFLRPKGGDARQDQRMQQYAMQLGYYGIAIWSASGSHESSNSAIIRKTKPGTIFLFHTTDADVKKLMAFIPWAVKNGYKLVTLNEMFGYPENETSELTAPVSEHTAPAPAPYKKVYVPLKKRTFSYYTYLLQQKLVELGYLSITPNGAYAAESEEAVKKYQKEHGLEVTGIADPALLEELLGT